MLISLSFAEHVCDYAVGMEIQMHIFLYLVLIKIINRLRSMTLAKVYELNSDWKNI